MIIHEMKLNESSFDRIKNGKKTVEEGFSTIKGKKYLLVTLSYLLIEKIWNLTYTRK